MSLTVKVLIADNDAQVRTLLRELLEERSGELFLQSDNGVAVRYRHPMRFRFWKRDSFADLVRSGESQA
jgi:CheY-like chemotaxis protein